MNTAPALINVPAAKRDLLDQLVDQLSRVPGVAAIVLGGSYAGGTQHATSDLDVGLYYFEDKPFAIDTIRPIATNIAVDGNPTVTDFYQWGAWVNGGAWIQTSAGKVDFLYRNLDQIERTIADAQQGIGSTAPALAHTVQQLAAIWQKVVTLAGDLYHPKFQL